MRFDPLLGAHEEVGADLGTSIKCRRCRATTELRAGSPSVCSNCGAELDVTIDLETGRITARPSVLIVDDEAGARAVARAVLESGGFSVVAETSNGPDAALLASEHQPDFVVLDYRMPAMSGEHASRLVRRVSPESRIVLFSAVIEGRPEWAEAAVRKDEVDRLAEALGELVRGGG